MAPLVAELAAAFTQRFPTISVQVTGVGTSYGLEALLALPARRSTASSAAPAGGQGRADEADIAMASWVPPDVPKDWRVTAIARDGIAVIVHPDNSVDGLGLLQVRALFGGRADEWQAVDGRPMPGPVQPVSREEGSGTRAVFEALVMEGWRVTPRAVVASSSQAVVEFVAGHPEAIGYVSMALVTRKVKVLRIEGELPTPDSVVQGRYPLGRELWLVTSDPPSSPEQAFLDFASGPVGQQIVGQRYGRIR